ncbi:hypothetical protein R1sor_021211 [Riccia sorocarpa]|uniref:HNH domain-containing protein n=1 Tax=Riccia sorocarpa TaxID=122646 RepID=A0ABD3GGE0_9MARC
MVNAGSYFRISDRPFLHGSGRCSQLAPAAHNLQISRPWGCVICRRDCPVTLCKLKKGDDSLRSGKLAIKSKRKEADISEARHLKKLQSSDPLPSGTSTREVSTHGVASPASEMEMIAEEYLEAHEDDEFSVYRGLVLIQRTGRPHVARRSLKWKKINACRWYCYSRENLTIDHVVAVSRGGGWTWDNLRFSCLPPYN